MKGTVRLLMPANRSKTMVWLLCLVALAIRANGQQRTSSRGYLTTPQELRLISDLGSRGIEPYRSAIAATVRYADHPWSWAPIDGGAVCSRNARKSPTEPVYLSQGSVLVYAKALAFQLTGNEQYARDAMSAIEGLFKITEFGSLGPSSPAERQCQLNASWYVPGFIRAADLLESYTPWSATGRKRKFQDWLANVVYPTISFTAEVSVSNWGAAATNASSYIADYLWDRPDLRLVSYNAPGSAQPTTTRTPAEAYEHAIQLALGRMNGTRAEAPEGSTDACDLDPSTKSMIRPDGGIPDELRRGSTGCNGAKILRDDKSNMYTQTHLQNLIAQAELTWRRGDRRIYDNLVTSSATIQYKDPNGVAHTVSLPSGRGSLRQAILFVIADPSRQRPRALSSALEVAFRYYRDPEMLRAVLPSRPNSGARAMSFETLSHGFAPDENPGPPPTVAPPR